MKFDRSVSLKKRYTKTLENFRGVDLSTSPLYVSPSRASASRNMIPRGGINHKRYGWDEMLSFGGDKINGIFNFEEDGDPVLLVHAGTVLYLAKKVDGVWEKQKVSGDRELSDERSQCFYRDGMAFLVGCGEYLVYGKHDGEYSLKSVSEIAYAPNTLLAMLVPAAVNVEQISDTNEQVNLLTRKRRNTFYFESSHRNNEPFTVTLDAAIKDDTLVTVKGTISPLENKQAENENGELVYGSILYDSVGTELARISANGKTISFVADDTFIEKLVITFEAAGDDLSGRIGNCRFGAQFGVDGASDRLFLAGNGSEPNRDFFSEAEDFTYFPDGNVLTVGNGYTPITGYARLSDSTLAVFKGEGAGSPAVFYRTGKEVSVAGNLTALFPTVAGTAGEYLVSPHAVATLSGDVLMLSRNGVFGIELSSNLASVERYTRERSRAIYEDLRQKNLENAVGVSFRGRYYLCVGDEEETCYVADSRYRAAFEGSSDTGYEWWVWDHIPANCFAVYNDELLFGTPGGQICHFGDRFCDRYYTEIAEGSVTQSGEGVLFETSLGVKAGDHVTLAGKLYAELLSDCEVKEGRICFSEDEFEWVINHVWEGVTLFVDCVQEGEEGLSVREYTVKDIDAAGLSFSLLDATPQSGGFRLSIPLSGIECVIEKMDGNVALLSNAQGDSLRLIKANGEAETQPTGKITHYIPVVAMWQTPVLDLGSNLHEKTILGITLAFDHSKQDEVRVWYETMHSDWEGSVRGPSGLDFDSLDFNEFSFNAAFASTHTKRINQRGVNYIRVGFRSEKDADCAVSGISLYYKINRMNRGIV